MEPLRTMLTDPAFAKDPPIKMNVNARTLGLVVAILAGIGLLLEVVGVLGVLSVGAFYAAAGFAGVAGVAFVGLAINLIATGMALAGGWRMSQGDGTGKPLVIYALAIGFLGEVVVGIGYYSVSNALPGLIVLAVLYYLVVISRFPGEELPPPA